MSIPTPKSRTERREELRQAERDGHVRLRVVRGTLQYQYTDPEMGQDWFYASGYRAERTDR